jgi:uncharacterized membrane protein
MKVFLFISIFLITPFVIITVFRKYQVAKAIGTVIMAYTVGVLLSFVFSFTDFLSLEETASLNKIQEWIMNICVPLAIPLMLFSSDFKLWTKSLPKTMITLITGSIAVISAVVISFFIFKDAGIPTLPKVSGMMAGFYHGGTMNFFALSKALSIDETVTITTLTSEMIIVFPIILFLTAGGYKLFRWLLPFKDEVHALDQGSAKNNLSSDIENYDELIGRKVFPRTLLGLLISLGFLIIAAGLSKLLTGKFNELVIILTITTLAIGASFISKIRSLPRTFELGMFFILIFSVIVASQFDVTKFVSSALNIFLFVLSITGFAFALHLILCRIFKIPGDLFTVGIMGLIVSPPFIPPIVAAMGNRKVLISGITIGLVGYAVGNYIGVGLFYLLGLF